MTKSSLIIEDHQRERRVSGRLNPLNPGKHLTRLRSPALAPLASAVVVHGGGGGVLPSLGLHGRPREKPSLRPRGFHAVAHRASAIRPGFVSLRTSRSKSALPPARLRAGAHRAGPSRPTPGATPRPLESGPPVTPRWLRRALVRADWEWPDGRQREIAPKGVSVSSTIAKHVWFPCG